MARRPPLVPLTAFALWLSGCTAEPQPATSGIDRPRIAWHVPAISIAAVPPPPYDFDDLAAIARLVRRACESGELDLARRIWDRAQVDRLSGAIVEALPSARCLRDFGPLLGRDGSPATAGPSR